MSNDAKSLVQRAYEALRAGQVSSAGSFANDALALDPARADTHALLAQINEMQHDLPQARQHAARALDADPNNAVACLSLGRIQLREGDFAGAETTLTDFVQWPDASDSDRSSAWSMIGDARDRLGHPFKAFGAFATANQILLRQRFVRPAQPSPVHAGSVRAMTEFAKHLDLSRYASAASLTPAPIFLIGFPRSGTTLLDQILSSHSQIVCLEEKEFLTEALSQVLAPGAGLDRLANLSADEISTVRHAYWERVQVAAAASPGMIVIDKMPLHVTLTPILRLIFPDARYIFAMRDPRDVILSCYQQHFKLNAAMEQFLQLETAATLYDAVMGLWLVCRERLQLRFCEVRYEDVVANLEHEVRRLAEFLDLEFEVSMLDHQSTALKRSILTPSASQVVEPIYERSVGRWRRYETNLRPVLPILNPWASRLGYDA